MKLPTQAKVWHNGELVEWRDAQVHVATHALHYATSVFEGLRGYATVYGGAAGHGTAIVQLDAHVKRLLDSCRISELPLRWDFAQAREAVLATVRANGFKSCYIRPLVYRGCGALGVDPSNSPVEMSVIVIEHGAHFGPEAYARGISMCVSSWRRMAPDTLPTMAKAAANYLNSMHILLEARGNGFDDGIALDHEGYLSEGSGANLFVVARGKLFTPSLGSSILEGVTRGCVLTLARELGLEVLETRIPREMLYVADEVFVTGTAAEVTPVRSIDRKPIGAGARGPLTERLQQAYLAIVRGEVADRHGWLTIA